jgi:uncharacterized membrane protein YidH (DUF202 family)
VTSQRPDSLIEPVGADADAVRKNESVSVSRIQLILAEKRTTLAVMRTGIGVFTLPLSVITVLVATSRYYDVLETYHLLVPLLGLCLGLIVLGIYLVHRSVRRIRKQDALINRIKQQDLGLAEFYGGQL